MFFSRDAALNTADSKTSGDHQPTIRAAQPADVETIAQFVHDLALTEDFPGAVTSTPVDVHDVLFGSDAFARALVVETETGLVGFALYYPTYSTVTGRRGLHLEDLFIAASHRNRGLGEKLMRHLAAEAELTRGRLEWWVLHTNTSGHRFYNRLGARMVDEVGVWRLAGTAGPP